MSAPLCRVSRLVDASQSYAGVAIVRLADGSTLRALLPLVEQLARLPEKKRLVAYDVDDAGNRYNPRVMRVEEAERYAAARPYPPRGDNNGHR